MIILGQWDEEEAVTRSSAGREKQHEREQARKQEEQQSMESTEQRGWKQKQQLQKRCRFGGPEDQSIFSNRA